MTTPPKELHLQTQAIHGDYLDFPHNYTDIAPPLHVATNYRYPADPEALQTAAEVGDLTATHVYSRFSIENTSRLEVLLSKVFGGHVVTYASGLTAFHNLLTHWNPKTLAIGECYHGNRDVADIHTRLTGMKQVPIEGEKALEGIGAGDIVHIETPINPTGEAVSIEAFAKAAHAKGALLSVDSTFAPPPLQDPFKFGADIVLHSGTKYVGGHSDMLCGLLVVKDREIAHALRLQRAILGGMMGNLEGWLGLRSIRTLSLRVERASKNAEELVQFLHKAVKDGDEIIGKVVKRVRHASVQEEGNGEDGWLRKQMPNGFGPVFVIETHTPKQARYLPSKVKLFHHATSLGGVESLIEWRAMSDRHISQTILRVSVGVENVEDLKEDLKRGCEEVVKALAKDTVVQ